MKHLVPALLLLISCTDTQVSNFRGDAVRFAPDAAALPESSDVPRDAAADSSDSPAPDARVADAGLDTGLDTEPESFDASTPQTVETFDASTKTEGDAFLTDSGLTDSGAGDAGDAAAPAVCPIPAALGSECDVVTSCGCDEGTVCRVANQQSGQTLCFDEGTTAHYAACGFDQDCGTGAVCEGGICRPTCETRDTLCSDDSWCGALEEEGRLVCLGHCNVLELASNYNDAAFWKEQQVKLHEREFSSLPIWTLDYVPCGEGGYCRPGLEGVSPFPYCIRAADTKEAGTDCNIHQECLSGLACYDSYCRQVGFTESSCAEGFSMERTGLDPTEWGGPDGYNAVGVCTPNE
jgi:hypothetical protein